MDCMDSLSGPHIKTKQPSTLTLISVFGAILPREPHTQLKNVPNKDKAYFMNEPYLFQPPKKCTIQVTRTCTITHMDTHTPMHTLSRSGISYTVTRQSKMIHAPTYFHHLSVEQRACIFLNLCLVLKGNTVSSTP